MLCVIGNVQRQYIMTKNFRTILLILLLTIGRLTFSQTCEDFNKKLIHSLPENFPEKINCKDDMGKKQGWWINYKKSTDQSLYQMKATPGNTLIHTTTDNSKTISKLATGQQ